MKNTSQCCIMLLNPTMNTQQDAGQSLCGKVLIFPICHLPRTAGVTGFSTLIPIVAQASAS